MEGKAWRAANAGGVSLLCMVQSSWKLGGNLGGHDRGGIAPRENFAQEEGSWNFRAN
jgi:hypothetical protein